MNDFNLRLSYAVITAIRTGLNDNVPEDDKLPYTVDTAEEIFIETDGYDLEKTIGYIKSNIETTNRYYSLSEYKTQG